MATGFESAVAVRATCSCTDSSAWKEKSWITRDVWHRLLECDAFCIRRVNKWIIINSSAKQRDLSHYGILLTAPDWLPLVDICNAATIREGNWQLSVWLELIMPGSKLSASFRANNARILHSNILMPCMCMSTSFESSRLFLWSLFRLIREPEKKDRSR